MSARPFRKGDSVGVGDHPDEGVIESIAPASVGGERYAVIYWPEHNVRSTWRESRLRLA